MLYMFLFPNILKVILILSFLFYFLLILAFQISWGEKNLLELLIQSSLTL